jgi:hypothetical protein
VELFKTDDGQIHAMRIGSVIAAAAVLLSCADFRVTDMCGARVVGAIGWCVAFGGKRPGSAPFGIVSRTIGLVLLFAGAFGQFYLLWFHRHH